MLSPIRDLRSPSYYERNEMGPRTEALLQHLCQLRQLEDIGREAQTNDTNPQMADLTKEVLRHFIRNRQPDSLFFRKIELRDHLYTKIKDIFPQCGLYIVGSSMNGFGTNCSDMDICLMIKPGDMEQRIEAVQILKMVSVALENGLSFVRGQQLILAKVPILRIQFGHPFEDIIVDLNVNNSVAIKNTHLLFYYSKWDWRVRPLVLIIKEWAKRQGINDASRSTLSSYSLVLMIIHYLQSVDVVPCLQKLYKNRFQNDTDVRSLNITKELDPSPIEAKNRQSLAELLIGFLDYYAYNFDFDQFALSIRLGTKVSRSKVTRNFSPYSNPSQWRCLCIEEPFILSNTAHSVYDQLVFDGVKKVFIRSHQEVEKDRRLVVLLASGSFCGIPAIVGNTTPDVILSPTHTSSKSQRRNSKSLKQGEKRENLRKNLNVPLSVSALFTGSEHNDIDHSSSLIPAVRMLMAHSNPLMDNSKSVDESTMDSGCCSEISSNGSFVSVQPP